MAVKVEVEKADQSRRSVADRAVIEDLIWITDLYSKGGAAETTGHCGLVHGVTPKISHIDETTIHPELAIPLSKNPSVVVVTCSC